MTRRISVILFTCFLSAVFILPAWGQDAAEVLPPQDEPVVEVEVQEEEMPVVTIKPVEMLPAGEDKSGNITLDFKDADIQNVLRVLAFKSGINIVAGKEVVGTVTIRLVDVPWEQALAVILNTYGFAYERDGNIITVSTVDGLKERREKQRELTEIEGVTSKVFSLQFLDAVDAKKMLEPQLSPQGKISVLEITGQKGWKVGVPAAGGQETDQGKERRERENARSHSLIITDTPSSLDRIAKILKEIDVKPQQVLIEARIMEVNRDVLKDLGVEFSTGTRLQTHAGRTDANGDLLGTVNVGSGHHTGVMTGRNYSSSDDNSFSPANFVPLASGLTAENAGIEVLFEKLMGKQMEVMVHALEEDVRTNTLSAPKILTLSGQEALILIGQKYPIIETQISGTAGNATINLAYYQDVGIQLYVVPQITGDEQYVNMIVHPVISSFTETVSDNEYPILVTREAETQVLMRDGETIVIGGLLKDVKSKGKIGVPLLSDIPVLGALFTRYTDDVEKIDLLIFITARIIKPGELTEQDMAMVKQALEAGQPNISPQPAKKDDKGKDKKDSSIKVEGYSKAKKSANGNAGYLNTR
jgi:type IV pilus assembly protein PilQ